MERKIRFRVTMLVVFVAALVSLFTLRIYKLQAAQTEETVEMANSLTFQTRVDAARGQILDRNGTVLVTNRASYDLVMINFVFFNGPNPNEDLIELLNTCDELGIEIQHHLPVSESRPYQYTTDSLGETWAGYFRKYLNARSLDSDISAGTFMNKLRGEYNLPEELTDDEAYRLIAVRYELELRSIDNMPLDNYVLAEDVDSEDLAAIIELGIPGVIVQTSTVREYKTPYASHLLGYTTKMSAEAYEDTYKAMGYAMDAEVGREGVELAFEEYLHGEDGWMSTTITSTGEILDQSYTQVPIPGGNVELTIDIELQEVAYKALEEWILELRQTGARGDGEAGTDAMGGAVVAIDVKTGEVLASASYPTYNANSFAKDYARLAQDPNKPLINRCINAQYAPGSTYKMITGITAMEYANVSPWYEVIDNGSFTKFEGEGYAPACHIYRSSGRTHGVEDMRDALADSCNFYFYDVGLQCKTDDVDHVASMFGLGEPTGIELIEFAGQRANRETKAKTFAGTQLEAWVDGDKLQASIGQSLNEFTPMQLAVYCATLANNGTRMKATYLRRVVSWDFKELLMESEPTVVSEFPMKQTTIDAIREGMIAATAIGKTADPFGESFYPITVAAKTGTAQHGDGSSSDNASLVCYAPAEEPQIAIAIYVENGAVGGKLANIAMKVFDEYFSQTGKYETVYGENEVR